MSLPQQSYVSGTDRKNELVLPYKFINKPRSCNSFRKAEVCYFFLGCSIIKPPTKENFNPKAFAMSMKVESCISVFPCSSEEYIHVSYRYIANAVKVMFLFLFPKILKKTFYIPFNSRKKY